MPSDIYGGRDPAHVPAYPLREAAYYLRVSPGTLRHWVAGGLYETATGRKRYPPVVEVARRDPFGFSFFNLIELHVLRAMRRAEEIPMQRIRKALDFVQKEMQVAHPLVNQRFETDGLDLFVDRYGHLIKASGGGMVVMREAIEATLHRIQYDASGNAFRFALWVRDPLEEHKVIVDPRISFGRAVLMGTGVPISILASRYRAGETEESIAKDYRLTVPDVKSALRWEPLAKAA